MIIEVGISIFSKARKAVNRVLFIHKGRTVTTVMEEKRYNPRLTKSRQEFIQLMKTLNLAYADENQMGETYF